MVPGSLVSVHEPADGRPLRTILPVATVQVGGVIVLTTGAEGVTGWAGITTFDEATDIHPSEFVTVNVKVPEGILEIVVLVPVPDVVVPPGILVNVQVPADGNPLSTALPVETVQVGAVIAPAAGADGVGGFVLITTPDDAMEVQPSEFVTVKVYVPAGIPITVVLAPVPEVVTDPGVRVTIQVPEVGKPLSITLPVPTSQVG
jgi:hypothetical protein